MVGVLTMRADKHLFSTRTGQTKDDNITGWTMYVIHPGIFLSKLYNDENFSTM